MSDSEAAAGAHPAAVPSEAGAVRTAVIIVQPGAVPASEAEITPAPAAVREAEAGMNQPQLLAAETAIARKFQCYPAAHHLQLPGIPGHRQFQHQLFRTEYDQSIHKTDHRVLITGVRTAAVWEVSSNV